MKVDIEARREKILRIVINTYITSGNPVSSRTICSQYRLGLCTASIRNVLADLEELGLITHLHTSAGRVPTDKGYRFYVDRLLEHNGLTREEQGTISKEYLFRQLELEEVVRKTSRILSDFTRYTALVSHPELKRSRFKRIYFTVLDAQKICATLIANTGMTKSTVIQFDFKIDSDQLQRIENFMNTELENIPLTQLKPTLRRMMIEERNSFFHVLKQAIDLIDVSALVNENMRFYLEGISNILRFPEFEDSDIIRSLMHVLEEKMALSELVQDMLDQEPAAKNVRVFIGGESSSAFLNDCALVLGGYTVDNQIVGGLGIIGPKRMDYGKTIATVQYVSETLSNILSRFSI